MNPTINAIKMLYQKNKMLFAIALIVAVLFIAGCAPQSGAQAAPQSQFIGGGCGA